MNKDDTAPFQLSKERRVSMPLALLFVLLTAVGVGAVALNTTRDQVARNTTAITELQTEAKTTREILIRIDENVKQLKEKR
jgi:hypothetical protein